MAVGDALHECAVREIAVEIGIEWIVFAVEHGGGAVKVFDAAVGSRHEGVLVLVTVVDRLKVAGQVIDGAGLMDPSPFVLEVEVADVADDERTGGKGLVCAKSMQDGEVMLEVALVTLGCEDVELV